MVAINIRPTLNKADKKKFLSLCHLYQYAAKTCIPDDQSTKHLLFYIVKGSMTINATTEDDETANIVNLCTGDFFCHTDLSPSENIKSIQIQASEDCDIAAISHNRFSELITDSPEYSALLSPMMIKLIIA